MAGLGGSVAGLERICSRIRKDLKPDQKGSVAGLERISSWIRRIFSQIRKDL